MQKFTMISVIALFISVNITALSKDSVQIDFSMVEKGIEWIELVNSGAEPAAIKTHFMENVAPTPGCQAIIMHWSRFMEWNEETFYNFITEALDPHPDKSKMVNKDGTQSFFALRHMLWQTALKNLPQIRKDLQILKSTDFSKSITIARTFLPDEAILDVRFSFVLFGHSSAFSVGRENGYDYLQLPRTSDGALDREKIIRTFAHELHHSGFMNPTNEHTERFQLLGLLAAEGMATYFIDEIDANLSALKNSSDPMENAVAADWIKHNNNLAALYAQAAVDIQTFLNGTKEQNSILGFWLDGAKGPAYVLGADMIRTIDTYLGREQAISIAKDYRQFIHLYNQAAKNAQKKGKSSYIFPNEIETKISRLIQ